MYSSLIHKQFIYLYTFSKSCNKTFLTEKKEIKHVAYDWEKCGKPVVSIVIYKDRLDRPRTSK